MIRPHSAPSSPTYVVYFGAALFGLLTLALFINLGLAPLKLEEPRRALITLEMLLRDNAWVPTEMGEFYYKKPPAYNWVLMASYWLWGDYSEWATRFFSVLSFVSMGVLVFAMGQRYVSRVFGIYSGLLTLAMVDIVFYFSTVAGEIDLFYSFITLASFFTLFHFYERGQYYAMFTSTYALGALGTLTKGLPSPVFLGVSVLAWLAYRRDLRQLLGRAHIVGILVFVAIVGGYFGYYHYLHDATLYFTSEESLWSQSSDRTAFNNSWSALVTHLVLFPLETFKNVAPATLLLPFLVRKRMLPVFLQQPFVAFCLVVLMSNLTVYWISPGTRSRYVYMLYPLLVVLLAYGFYSYSSEIDWRHRLVRTTVLVLIGLTLITGIVLPFIPALAHRVQMWPVAVAMLAATAGLLILQYRQPQHSLLHAVALVVILRTVFAFTILPVRTTQSAAQIDRQDGLRIAQLTHGEALYLYPNTRFSLSTVFYTEQARQAVLAYHSPNDSDAFFLADAALLSGQKYTVFYTFTYHDRPYLLVKFSERISHPPSER